MDLKFKVMIIVARPPAEVFEAVADPRRTVVLFHHRRRERPARSRARP